TLCERAAPAACMYCLGADALWCLRLAASAGEAASSAMPMAETRSVMGSFVMGALCWREVSAIAAEMRPEIAQQLGPDTRVRVGAEIVIAEPHGIRTARIAARRHVLGDL